MEPLLRGNSDERSTPMERPLINGNVEMKVYIRTPEKMPPLLEVHFSGTKRVASQMRFHCL